MNEITSVKGTQPIYPHKDDGGKRSENAHAARVDTIDKSAKTDETITYKKPVLSKSDVTEIRHQQKYELMTMLVGKLFEVQGELENGGKLMDGIGEDEIRKLKALLDKGLPVDPATRSAAEAAVASGGSWSAEAVSERLVNFALRISGGDESKLELIKSAINEGFRQAEKIFGGILPDICYETRRQTTEKLEKVFRVEKSEASATA